MVMLMLLYRASNSNCGRCQLKSRCCQYRYSVGAARCEWSIRDVARAIPRIELFAQDAAGPPSLTALCKRGRARMVVAEPEIGSALPSW